MEGIRSYFDRALGSILLYRMERKQFDDIRQQQPDALASDLYGAEHLIRLFGAFRNFCNTTYKLGELYDAIY